MVETVAMNVRLPPDTIDELDEHVDGIRVRSRAQLVAIIIMEWLEEHEGDLEQ